MEDAGFSRISAGALNVRGTGVMMVDVAATAVVANGVVLIAATPVWGLISRASAGPREAGRANRITGQHKHTTSPKNSSPGGQLYYRWSPGCRPAARLVSGIALLPAVRRPSGLCCRGCPE